MGLRYPLEALVIVSTSYALSPRPEGGSSGQISPETPPDGGLALDETGKWPKR